MVSLHITQTTDMVTVSGHKKIVRTSLTKVVVRHRDVRLPRRFIKGPKTREGGEFGFKRRTRKYQVAKKKKVGHLKPNVYTGETQKRAKAAKTTATATRGKISFRSHFQMPSERAEEIERLSDREIKADVEKLRSDYITLSNSPRFRRKRRKRLT